jgi:hypothetical protein
MEHESSQTIEKSIASSIHVKHRVVHTSGKKKNFALISTGKFTSQF